MWRNMCGTVRGVQSLQHGPHWKASKLWPPWSSSASTSGQQKTTTRALLIYLWWLTTSRKWPSVQKPDNQADCQKSSGLCFLCLWVPYTYSLGPGSQLLCPWLFLSLVFLFPIYLLCTVALSFARIPLKFSDCIQFTTEIRFESELVSEPLQVSGAPMCNGGTKTFNHNLSTKLRAFSLANQARLATTNPNIYLWLQCNCSYDYWLHLFQLMFGHVLRLPVNIMVKSVPYNPTVAVFSSSSTTLLSYLSHPAACHLKVPYYTVFNQFHTAVRGQTTLYLKCIAPNPSVVLNFSCLKVVQVSSTELYWEQAVSVPAPLNANELCLSTPALPATGEMRWCHLC